MTIYLPLILIGLSTYCLAHVALSALFDFYHARATCSVALDRLAPRAASPTRRAI